MYRIISICRKHIITKGNNISYSMFCTQDSQSPLKSWKVLELGGGGGGGIRQA